MSLSYCQAVYLFLSIVKKFKLDTEKSKVDILLPH